MENLIPFRRLPSMQFQILIVANILVSKIHEHKNAMSALVLQSYFVQLEPMENLENITIILTNRIFQIYLFVTKF